MIPVLNQLLLSSKRGWHAKKPALYLNFFVTDKFGIHLIYFLIRFSISVARRFGNAARRKVSVRQTGVWPSPLHQQMQRQKQHLPNAEHVWYFGNCRQTLRNSVFQPVQHGTKGCHRHRIGACEIVEKQTKWTLETLRSRSLPTTSDLLDKGATSSPPFSKRPLRAEKRQEPLLYMK